MPPATVSEAAIAPLLRQYWGFDTLRPLQLDAIRAGVHRRDSLVVLPTGGGKSLCYQVPPLLTDAFTVVVSPLISLMKDQVDGLHLANYPAAAIHSGVSGDEAAAIRRQAIDGELRLLFVAPERLLNSSFISFLRQADRGRGVGSFAIDEAHCISQWGHDFRPEYRRLAELRSHFPEAPLHAYTATATPRVRQDIIDQLSLRDPEVLVGIFDRPNLTYRILPRLNTDDQIEEVLRRHVSTSAGVEGRAAIVYCISRKDTERLAETLTSRGIKAEAYHAGLSDKTRHRVQERFASERLDVVVATVAFGMGIDRSDVRCVVHASMPKTVEHYQQETGRAGRDGLPSECVLFYSSQDVMRWKQLMQRSAAESESPPDPETMQAQFDLLEHMQRLCAGVRCRHRALSEYFGQEYTPPAPATDDDAPQPKHPAGCGACDVCLGELAAVPGSTEIAQKILSCIYRMRQAGGGGGGGIGFGAAHIADVLRGASTAKVLQRAHDQLSTFGLLRQFDKNRIVSCINQLVDQDALIRDPREFATLSLGPAAAPILRGQHEVELFEPRAPRPARASRRADAAAGAPAEPLSADEHALFESLRSLRRTIAEELRLPPYLVFGDATLEEIARVRPGSLESFAAIRGVGTAKLTEFGDRFLRHVAAFCREHQLPLDAARGTRPRRITPSKPAASGSLSATKRQAFDMFERGSSIDEVAAATARARSTCAEYLAEWIAMTRPATVAPWVDDKTYDSIVEVAAKLQVPRFKPIFDHFGGAIAYDQIRVVMTHRQALDMQ